MDILLNVVLTAAGLAMLTLGGHWLVEGSVGIARRFGISHFVIGVTIVAIGTSTPELAASLAAGDNGEIILGNVVGSNVANIGMVIGAALVMAPMVIRRSLKMEMFAMIGFSLLLISLSIDGILSHVDGAVLVGLLVAFTVYMYKSARGGEDAAAEHGVGGTGRSMLYVGVGMALLAAGAILTIDNAEALARTLGISDRIIGLTVIAIGTSLPELITSVIAIRRGHTDIGIGNIIGSNIYNILMIAGVSATISGIVVAPQVFGDYAVMMAFSLVMLVGLKMGRMGKLMGIGLLSGYVLYHVINSGMTGGLAFS